MNGWNQNDGLSRKRACSAFSINSIAALWGLVEATVFFIVPDVFLSALGLRNLRAAIAACLFALGGALVGGAVMHAWASRDVPGALTLGEAVPAISPGMLEQVRRDLIDEGVLAILIGPLYGTPYKTFAVQAAAVGIGLAPFLLISVPARLGRFLAVTLFSWWVGDHLLSGWTPRTRLRLLLTCWMIFYACYFSVMPN